MNVTNLNIDYRTMFTLHLTSLFQAGSMLENYSIHGAIISVNKSGRK